MAEKSGSLRASPLKSIIDNDDTRKNTYTNVNKHATLQNGNPSCVQNIPSLTVCITALSIPSFHLQTVQDVWSVSVLGWAGKMQFEGFQISALRKALHLFDRCELLALDRISSHYHDVS